MTQPKKKTTARKKGFRRAHHFLKVPGMSTCPSCQTVKPPHQVCPSCGVYNGKEVINVVTE